ncbi:MAG: hypothetical protein ACM3SY_11830 [Candidatus Omnitrophota bacterium]
MNKAKWILYFGLILFLGVQIFLYFNGFFTDRLKPLSIPLSDSFTGNILFTGDTSGAFDLASCERFGSLSRRSALLNKFGEYLYVDTGNFTSENPTINTRTLMLFAQAYRYMNLSAMNITKRDLIALADANAPNMGAHFVSANLEIHTPENLKNAVSTFRLIPLTLKRGKEARRIMIGVTGITHNERQLHDDKVQFTITAIENSLAEVLKSLEQADIKILLFNESYFTLKRLIMQDKLKFDLIIARATLPDQENRVEYINHIPVVFPSEYGRSLGYIRVSQTNSKFKFDFNAFDLGMGAPLDKNMETISRAIRIKIREKSAPKTTSGVKTP